MNDSIFLQELEKLIGERFNTGLIRDVDIPQVWKQFPLSWLCYGERKVCIREISPIWSDNDTASDIINLFETYYRVIVNKIEQTLGITFENERSIGIYVQPDYLDTCAVLIIQRNLYNLAYIKETKAWQMVFKTPDEMENELKNEYESIFENIK